MYAKKCNEEGLENQTYIDKFKKRFGFGFHKSLHATPSEFVQNFSSWVWGYDDFAPVCEINYSDFDLWTNIVST